MGFLQLLRKQPAPKKNLGICVPDHIKKSKGEGVHEQIISHPNGFLVRGIFAVHGSVMIQGEMIQGTVKPGAEIEFDGKCLTVVEIFADNKPSELLEQGQSGALFVNADLLPILRAGDVLEF